MPVAVVLIGSLGDGLGPPPASGGANKSWLSMLGVGLLPLIVMLICIGV